MLRLRPYKMSDAKTIITWCKDEITFRKWTSDRYESFPIKEEDMNDTKRGMGYGKEMISLSLKYAFEIFKADKVTIGAFENNMPAYYCYKSAGFEDVKTEDVLCELFGEKWKVLELEFKKENY